MRPLLVLSLLSLVGARAELAPTHGNINRQFAESDAVAVGNCLSVGLLDPNQPAERDGHLVPQDYVGHYALFRVYKGTANGNVAIRWPQRNPDSGPPSCAAA